MNRVCTRCKVEKLLSEFYTNGKYADGSVQYRPDCKACHTDIKRVPNENKRYHNDPKDDVFRLCRRLAHDARSRVLAPSRHYKRSYRNLDTPFGFESTREMYLYLYNEYKDDIISLLAQGKRPSVDRIDSARGYAPGNIRVIDHTDNTLLGVDSVKRKVIVISPDGSARTYQSVKACAKDYGTTDGHVRGWINGKWRPSNGCTFRYAN